MGNILRSKMFRCARLTKQNSTALWVSTTRQGIGKEKKGTGKSSASEISLTINCTSRPLPVNQIPPIIRNPPMGVHTVFSFIFTATAAIFADGLFLPP